MTSRQRFYLLVGIGVAAGDLFCLVVGMPVELSWIGVKASVALGFVALALVVR